MLSGPPLPLPSQEKSHVKNFCVNAARELLEIIVQGKKGLYLFTYASEQFTLKQTYPQDNVRIFLRARLLMFIV